MKISETAGTAATWLALGLIAAAGIRSWDPPAPAGPNAPLADFSAVRAMAHVRAIAVRPHPVGSEANAAVRDYLTGQLRALGLSPEVQKGIGLRSQSARSHTAGLVENIAARLPGTGGGKAVMLVSHYDSVSTAPGASDAGHGVAAILETLRALRQSGPLERDVIALFSDGEEAGLLGAEAFVSGHRWAREVAVAFNFEARGARGPALMFETSARNGPLIRELAGAGHPVASSVSYEVYKRLPNDTDFSVFKRAGIAGLNFAYLDGALFYHTAADDQAHLDMRSLQHQGDYALHMARRFASGGLDKVNLEGPDMVYFSIPGRTLVRYPQSWAVPMALAACAGLVFVLLRARRARAIRGSGVFAGMIVLPVAVAAAGAAGAVTWWILRQCHAGRLLYGAESHLAGRYKIGFILLALAVTAAVYGLALRRWSAAELGAGAHVWWCGFAVAFSLSVPGVSYLFLWPLAFLILGMLAPLAIRDPLWAAGVANACGAAGVLIWAPVLWLLWVGMGLSLTWLVCSLVALLAGLLAPQTAMLATAGNGRFPWVPGAAAAAVLFGWAAIGPAFQADSPRPDSLMYVIDADAGTARWATWDRAPDEWTVKVLTARPERSRLTPPELRVPPLLNNAAPAGPGAPLELELKEDKAVAGKRRLVLRVSSPRGGVFAWLATTGPAELIEIGGRSVKAAAGVPPGPLNVRIAGLGRRSIPLVIEVAAGSKLQVATLDAAYAFPEEIANLVGPRPSWIMAGPQPLNGATVITKKYGF